MLDFLDDFESICQFKKKYFDVLTSTVWADGEYVARNMEEYMAVSVPVAEFYVDSVFRDGKLILRSHVNLSNECFDEHCRRVFDLFNIDYSLFKTSLEDLKTDFHNEFYFGTLGYDGEPEYSSVLKKILDPFFRDFYREGMGTYTKSDYTFVLGIRIDNLFTSKALLPSMELRAYDNDLFFESGTCWSPTQPIGSYSHLISMFNHGLNKLFGSHRGRRTQLGLLEGVPGTAYAAKSSDWLNMVDTAYTTRLPHVSDLLKFCSIEN